MTQPPKDRLVWIPAATPPTVTAQVICFSPAYAPGEQMRFRIMDAQFVKSCTEVTHWAYLYMLEPKGNT